MNIKKKEYEKLKKYQGVERRTKEDVKSEGQNGPVGGRKIRDP